MARETNSCIAIHTHSLLLLLYRRLRLLLRFPPAWQRNRFQVNSADGELDCRHDPLSAWGEGCWHHLSAKDIGTLGALPVEHSKAGGAVRAVDLALHLVLILHPRRTGRYKIGQTAVCRVVSLRITRGCHFHLSLLFEVRVVAKWLVRDQLLLSEEQGAAFATGEDFCRDEFFHSEESAIDYLASPSCSPSFWSCVWKWNWTVVWNSQCCLLPLQHSC